MVVDGRFGRMWGIFPFRFQDEVGPNDIAIRDVVRFTRINAIETQSDNPNHRYQAALTGRLLHPERPAAASHDIKAGVQLSWERVEWIRRRNGDLFLELRDGVPFQAQLSNTPIDSDHRLQTLGRLRAGSLGRRPRDDQRRHPNGRRECASARADESRRRVCRGADLSRKPMCFRSRSTSRRAWASPTTSLAPAARL